MYVNFDFRISPNALQYLTFQQLLSIIRRYKSCIKYRSEYCYTYVIRTSLELSNIFLNNIMNTIKLLSCKQLVKSLGWSKSTIYLKINQGLFPKPIHFGRTVRWRYIDIEEYVKNGGLK